MGFLELCQRLVPTLAAAGIATAALAGPAAPAAKVGRPAPPFTVSTYDNKKVSLAQLRGKVVVVNYWATWCGPCKTEMPMMHEVQLRYRDKGFEIYAVNVDDTVERAKVRNVQKVLSFRLAWKLSGTGYGTIGNAVPTSYVIDRAGVLRYAKAGSFEQAEFEHVVVPLLREPPPAP